MIDLVSLDIKVSGEREAFLHKGGGVDFEFLKRERRLVKMEA